MTSGQRVDNLSVPYAIKCDSGISRLLTSAVGGCPVMEHFIGARSAIKHKITLVTLEKKAKH